MRSIRRILVPVDFSEPSARALDDAIELAKTWGAELHLLHCHLIQPRQIELYGVEIPDEFDRDLHGAALQRLEEWGKKAGAAGVAVQHHLTARLPDEGVAALAEELDVDLIVMGTRGLSGLRHVLLGSVTERTLRVAPCPVWVVPNSERR